MLVGKLEDSSVARIPRQGFTQERDIVAELLEGNSKRPARRGRARTSLRSERHLPGNEQIDLPSVVFIIGEALVNLRSGELREAVGCQRVDRFATLE